MQIAFKRGATLAIYFSKEFRDIRIMFTARSFFARQFVLLCFTNWVTAEFTALNIAFFYGNDTTKFQLFPIPTAHEIFSNSAFNKTRKTLLYIHGYRENVSSQSVHTVVKAFIARDSHNILVLDWGVYAAGNYVTQVIPNLIQVKVRRRVRTVSV